MIGTGYTPGVVGDVTALHGRYYAARHGFAPRFELQIAAGMSAFFAGFDPARDFAAWVVDGDRVGGFIAIAAVKDDPAEARLRWFILDESLHGRGYGRALVEAAMAHVRATGFRRVELFTFSALVAARALYAQAGFRLIEATPDESWGAPITFERFELLV